MPVKCVPKAKLFAEDHPLYHYARDKYEDPIPQRPSSLKRKNMKPFRCYAYMVNGELYIEPLEFPFYFVGAKKEKKELAQG